MFILMTDTSYLRITAMNAPNLVSFNYHLDFSFSRLTRF